MARSNLFPLAILALGFCGMLFAEPATQPADLKAGEKLTSSSGLTIEKQSHGRGAKEGDIVYVLYTGKLSNGAVFDASSLHGNEAYPVKLGAGQVIKGWEEGLLGAQVGEKRHLSVPPQLGYGSQARGDKIPANSQLEFDVEIVGIMPG